MRERKDFVQVRLTAAGGAFAGEGKTLRIATARMHYVFVGDEAVEVLRAGEWTQLQRETDAQGNALFEPAPAASENDNATGDKE